MSFGGFGGFGSNNQNQTQGSTFGGFGSTAPNAGTGFGSSTNTGFGGNAGNTGSGLFGSGANANTGFGTAGGFGTTANNNTSAFGAPKPAFGGGTTAGGSLFGSTNNNAATGSAFGGGGFGSTTNNQAGGFGSTTGTGLFGSTPNKPAFGAATGTTGGGMFGGGGTGASTFGQSTGGFGQSAGFGQQNQQVNQGTGSTPFSAHQEKDTASNTTSHYQSVSFMQPYQNYSFEELRVADYNVGRKFGNTNGQAGAFGQSTGFGGFGTTTANASTGFGSTNNNTGGGLFASNNQSQSPFGQPQQNQQQNTTTGFGAGNSLFGQQNKPASTGLFGATPNSTATGTGGLFGTSNAQNNQAGGTFGGGFGQGNNTTGGLFGGTQNQQNQGKPFGAGFGTTTAASGFGSTAGGFGQQNNQSTGTGTGLFGASTTNNTNTGGLFGGNAQSQQTQPATSAFGGFGANNNQSQTANQNQQSGTTGSLFGGFGQQNNNNQNQQKPGGLFGSSTTGGTGLFGNNPQQNAQSGSNLFGNNSNQQQSSGLFGNKPATSGNSLFGGGNNANTGGGLFGNSQSQTQGNSLFGQNNQQKSLFGNNTGNTGGGSLFGTSNNANAGTSLFGNSQQQNAGSSLFGNAQQSQQQAQPQSLTASLMQNPYGNDQLFAGLGTPTPSVGPLATPLSGAQKPVKRSQMTPTFKINPSASMRLITPQKRPNGYGFSYSTYGTPGSVQSVTPGRNGGLFGSGGLSRPLSKSLSTSNLRNPLSAEDSILAPGAFTPNYRPYSAGSSIRRLKINRNLRTDLFGEPPAERTTKRVSFDGSATAAKDGAREPHTNGTASPGPNNALVRTESDGPEPSPEELGFLRSSKSSQKEVRTNGTSTRPEMEQVRGNELAIVPEDELVSATAPPSAKPLRKPQIDQEPGEYYMIPSMQDIRDMSRDQLKNVEPFIVGRVGIGKIEFSKVDLTAVDLDKIMGNIVQLGVRRATVYEVDANKPPRGKDLNVPSTITIENSWPRSGGGLLPVHERMGPRFERHVERLKRVEATEFVDYSPETGEWVFRVQHFTTYGLDYEDDETMMDPTEIDQILDTPTKVPTPLAPLDPIQTVGETLSPAESDPDDTFDFKKNAKTIPGAFGSHALDFEDNGREMDVTHEDEASHLVNPPNMEDPFDLGDDSQGLVSPPETDDEASRVIGAYPDVESAAPKSILKAYPTVGTPVKPTFQPNDDWAEQLQRTVSPRKQDRKALREQQDALYDEGGVSIKPGRSTGAPAFSTTMDIMNSLFTQSKGPLAKGRGGRGFEV